MFDKENKKENDVLEIEDIIKGTTLSDDVIEEVMTQRLKIHKIDSVSDLEFLLFLIEKEIETIKEKISTNPESVIKEGAAKRYSSDSVESVLRRMSPVYINVVLMTYFSVEGLKEFITELIVKGTVDMSTSHNIRGLGFSDTTVIGNKAR